MRRGHQNKSGSPNSEIPLPAPKKADTSLPHTPPRCVVCGVARPLIAAIAVDVDAFGRVECGPICTACWAARRCRDV